MDPSVLAAELGLLQCSAARSVSEVVTAVISVVQRSTTTDDQQRALILPPTMHAPTDIRRWYVLNPQFVTSLLTALLRECSGTHSGTVNGVCRAIIHILQSIAPLVDMSRDAALFEEFLSSAAVKLDYIVGTTTSLSVASAIVFALGLSDNPMPSILKAVRRRLEEASKTPANWNTDVSAMACLLTIEYLRPLAESDPLQQHKENHLGLSSWDALTKGPVDIGSGRAGSLSARGASQRREMSPDHSSSILTALSFPEKIPTNFGLPTSVIMSCMALGTEAVFTAQNAINLGIWFLTSLDTIPLTVTATALTQLLMKHGRTFKVISANVKQEQQMKFCEATIVVCSKAVTTLYERRVQHGVNAPYAYGDHEIVDDWDAVVHAVDVIPSFTILIIQAVRCSSGLLLCPKAQAAVGKLFVFLCRLYVSNKTYADEAPDKQSKRYAAHRVIEQCLRAICRAVDALLHDYEAGCPEVLRADLIASSAPHCTLLNRVESLSGGEMTDLLETIFAATVDLPLADAAMRTTKLAGNIPAFEEWSAQWGETGLSPRAKLWAARKMNDYLRREWYLARVGVHITTVTESAHSYFDCLPRQV